jgi:transcriptional regulator with PAS, ATPase and Fis domain
MEFIWLAPTDSRSRSPHGAELRILFADTIEQAQQAISEEEPSAIVIQTGDDADHGPEAAEFALAAIELWRERFPVWILAPGAGVSSAVRWIKAGAAHVAAGEEEIFEQMRVSRRRSERADRRTALVGNSHSMGEIEERIALVADRRCTVLIEGETGTGKEVVARAIHAAGSRARGPWVAVNCGAIPEPLLEAELFGYVKGAFTGAVQSRAGKFEAANRGTIFLDEIGDMPIAVQGKLLRVLQEREVVRLGGNESVRLDVRVIAATNARLAECVRNGTFRQDLFYRLNVFRMSLPPLRERRGDIALLAAHFVARICAGEKIPVKSLDPSATNQLMLHSWPGNVRELENTIETAVISSGARNTIFPSDLSWTHTAPFQPQAEATQEPVLPANGLDYERVIEDFEKNLLSQALTRTRGNKTAAASLLGMKRTTLAARMRALESRMPRLVA